MSDETVKPENEQPQQTAEKFAAGGVPFEIAKSKDLTLRHIRQLCSALYATVKGFAAQSVDGKKMLNTALDTAGEYNWLLAALDDFYTEARQGIYPCTIRLVAESKGATKEMKVSVQVDEVKDELYLAK